MKEPLVRLRNSLFHWTYTRLVKHAFFTVDPEVIHERISGVGATFSKARVMRGVLRALFGYQNPMLTQTVAGITFTNPIGLGAGFDKNGLLMDTLPQVGFGFMEVGSITAKPYEGNPKPRLHRLKQSRSLVVNYGLMNDGSEAIAKRMEGRSFAFPVGISVAMTNCSDNNDVQAAIADYVETYRRFAGIGSYTTLNLSCPNTCNDFPFLRPENLEALLTETDKIATDKPVFLKVSPDISLEAMDQLMDVAARHTAHGFIISNLTKNRHLPTIRDKDVPAKGGMSGKIMEGLSNRLLAHAYRRGKDRFVFIGLGGVFSAADAYRKIRLGASLVQMVTGMIYEGPEVISMINQGLVDMLKRDGFTSVGQAVGVDNQ